MKRKILTLSLMALSSAALLAGCGEEKTPVLAVVTDVGSINDHSFNEACYKGMVDFAEENDLGYAYYQPTENSTANRVATIDTAVEKGAEVIVLPGYLFNSTVKIVQDKYPDVHFLGVDVDPSDTDNNYASYEFADNVTSLKYYENEAGFFAGYAAVMEGYTKIGFLGGMSVPAVVKYGQGYLFGAEKAAEAKGLDDGAIQVNYTYAGGFSPTTDIQTAMSSWYTAGTEVIFSCGGGIYSSVVQAATTANGNLAEGEKTKAVIGVDVDQHLDSDLIITSAMKNMEPTVKEYLEKLYDNNMAWPDEYAGTTVTLGVDDGAVGLPTDEASWKLQNWTVEEYEALYADVVADKYPGLDLLQAGDDTLTQAQILLLTKLDVTYSASLA